VFVSATVPKRQLGMRLRQLREQLGLEREEAAKALDCSPSKIGRIETGDVGVKSAELRVLLDLYHVTDDEERDDLARLAGQSRGRRKRTDYAKAIPDWFRKYINLEEGATQVKKYDTELITGLLQTEAYARAITRANPLHDPHDVDRLVRARLARQKYVFDEHIELSVVMNEGVLHRAVGGPEVMREQLEHLVEMGRRDHVTIQVIPFERGAHAATGFAFSLLRLPNDDGLDVVYLEDLTSARYVDNDPEEQQRYGIIWSHLIRSASTPQATADFLTTLLRKP
jgi:transcriptional regulator with XRE-family HTH domain